MQAYLEKAKAMLENFTSWNIMNVDMTENQWVDVLSKLASSSSTTCNEPIYVEELHTPSIYGLVVGEVSSQPDWRTPFLEYILDNKLPESKNEARSLMYKARNYCVKDDKLYRRSIAEPLLRCLGPKEADLAIIEVHTGICGEHLGGKNLALKILRQAFF